MKRDNDTLAPGKFSKAAGDYDDLFPPRPGFCGTPVIQSAPGAGKSIVVGAVDYALTKDLAAEIEKAGV